MPGLFASHVVLGDAVDLAVVRRYGLVEGAGSLPDA